MTVPPNPRGYCRQVTPHPWGAGGGGGVDTTANQTLTGAYYAEFMDGQLLAVGCPRLWDTHGCGPVQYDTGAFFSGN